MSYHIEIKRSAQKSLSRIPNHQKENIIDAIRNLSKNPRPDNCKKLTGRNAWRIRISQYRVVYEIKDDKLCVFVIDIGHRKSIYK